jgi:ribosomal protein S27AE
MPTFPDDYLADDGSWCATDERGVPVFYRMKSGGIRCATCATRHGKRGAPTEVILLEHLKRVTCGSCGQHAILSIRT